LGIHVSNSFNAYCNRSFNVHSWNVRFEYYDLYATNIFFHITLGINWDTCPKYVTQNEGYMQSPNVLSCIDSINYLCVFLSISPLPSNVLWLKHVHVYVNGNHLLLIPWKGPNLPYMPYQNLLIKTMDLKEDFTTSQTIFRTWICLRKIESILEWKKIH
jgi:hypothetical protein